MSQVRKTSARCRFHSPDNHPMPPALHSSRPPRRTVRAVPPLFLIMIPLLTSAGDAAGGEIAWRKNYAAALHESRETDRPMLVQVKASWCGACTRMLRETYADPRIVERVNERFVPVELDADADEALVEAFRVEALPTTFVVMPDRRIAKRLTGYQAPAALGAHLAAVPRPERCNQHVAVAAALGPARIPMPEGCWRLSQTTSPAE